MVCFGGWTCYPKRKVSGSSGKKDPCRIFSLKELQIATNNFNHSNKLGEGGFGSVYWGKLSNGSEVAVKRLKVWSLKAEKEFSAEVEMLGSIHHNNLLNLRGYCVDGRERLIVYDYMPNLSLLSHLHGQYASEAALDWIKRMNIAIGSAEGVAYLHHSAVPHIIHRDVKSSNVLLDSDFTARVADFGFAKLIPEGASHVTTNVKGTLGYLAPEYAMWGKASKSCDVYSFGILLLELVSGRKPIEKLGHGVKRSIVQWATPLIEDGNVDEIVDPRLGGMYNVEECTRVVQAASMCVQYAPERRPTMLEVIDILKGKTTKDDNPYSTDDNDQGAYETNVATRETKLKIHGNGNCAKDSNEK